MWNYNTNSIRKNQVLNIHKITMISVLLDTYNWTIIFINFYNDYYRALNIILYTKQNQ